MEFLKHEGIEPLKLLLDKSKMYKDVILYNISWGNGPWNELELRPSAVICVSPGGADSGDFSKLLKEL